MTGAIANLFVVLCIFAIVAGSGGGAGGVWAQESQTENLLDVEVPNSFSYDSPLSQPDSLRSRPYFDFLSTLYGHDASKTALFRPYATKTV